MKKKEYIKPQIVDIECGVMTRLLDGSDIADPFEEDDKYEGEGEEDLARRQRFDLGGSINSLRGKNVWENEW